MPINYFKKVKTFVSQSTIKKVYIYEKKGGGGYFFLGEEKGKKRGGGEKGALPIKAYRLVVKPTKNDNPVVLHPPPLLKFLKTSATEPCGAR